MTRLTDWVVDWVLSHRRLVVLLWVVLIVAGDQGPGHRPGGGILHDATIVGALALPALVVLFGRATWWMPPWLARLLRVP